jgi:hypothetical protein
MLGATLQGKSEEEIAKFSTLFAEIQQQIDTKQLRPMIRTQYLRTAFQIPFDSTVRISLDTNLTMIKENPDDGPTCTVAGRCWLFACLPSAAAMHVACSELSCSLLVGQLQIHKAVSYTEQYLSWGLREFLASV